MNKVARRWISVIILIISILLTQYSIPYPVFSATNSSPKVPLTLQNSSDRYPLGKILEFAADPTATFDSSEAPDNPATNLDFKPSNSINPAFGFAKNAYWAKLSLRNDSDQQKWYLAIGPAYLDRVDLYIQKDGKWQIQNGGRIYPFSQRFIPDRNFIFPLEIPSRNETTIYLRFATASTLLIDANLYQPEDFWKDRYNGQLVHGILYGVMFFALIYNLFIFISLRDRSYLYFVLFIISVIITNLVLDGYAMQYLWSNAVWWNRVSIPVFILLIVSTSAVFTSEFLKTRSNFPRLHRWLVFLSAFGYLMAAICPFIPYRVAALIANITNVTMSSYILIGAIALWKKMRIARLFLLAWGSSLFITFFHAFVSVFAILPSQISSLDFNRIGAILPPILLSIALADRINYFQQQKNQDQQEKLRLTDELNQALVRSRDDLEKIVDERTRDLQEAKLLAESANLAKSQFLSNMSHELRTPLNAILGFTQLLQLDESIDSSHQQLLGYMRSSGNHLLDLINSVLDISAIESGNITLQQRVFSPAELLIEVKNTLVLKASKKKIALKIETTENLPKKIIGDDLKLRQVLINLVNNAVKFTKEGTVTLTASLHHDLDSPKDYQNRLCRLSFSIEDTGVGISPPDLENIFVPFFQTTEGQKQEGTGLGLTISKRLTQSMGGELTVQSAVGVGTIFTLRSLPFQMIGSEPTIAIANESSTISVNKALPNLKLLLAEDNEFNQMLMLSMLKQLGYQADVVTNGYEVLDALQASHYDVILMDMQMPEMDGIEATQMIRANPVTAKRPFIIAVTASALKEDRDRCFAAGVDDYISKPIQLTEINQALQRINTFI